MSDIKIINQATGAPDFKDGETIEAEIGQTIFNFLEPYARIMQIVMTTNGDGNILLMRAGTENSGLRLVRGQNIKSASFKKKSDKRFNKYTAYSQLDPLSNDGFPVDEIVSQKGETATDADIRSSRIFEFNTEEEMDNDTSFNRAEFEANIRRANSVNCTCIVQGHSINGQPIEVNTIAYYNDDFCGVSSDMLIHSVEYNYSLRTGSTTKIQMTFKDAFSLNAQQEAREAARQTIGDEF